MIIEVLRRYTGPEGMVWAGVKETWLDGIRRDSAFWGTRGKEEKLKLGK